MISDDEIDYDKEHDTVDDDDEDTDPEIIDVIPAVFEPAREEPNITVSLGHSQAICLRNNNFKSISFYQ